MGYMIKTINEREKTIAQFTAMMEDLGRAKRHDKRFLLHQCVEFIMEERWAFIGSEIEMKNLMTSIENALYNLGDETSMYYYKVLSNKINVY